MTLKIIACEVMKEELLAVAAGRNIEFEFISMGLHLHPEKLGIELQRILDSLTGYSRVVLAFGLCGGAAKNLRAGDFILTIPRVHDCIPLLLGSKTCFAKHRLEEIGTLYLSCGWMNGEKSIMSEYSRITEKYGEKKAVSVFGRMYSSYQRVLFIRTDNPEEERYLRRSQEISQVLKLQHHITQGDFTFIRKIVNGPWQEDDFITIEPWGILDEELFFA